MSKIAFELKSELTSGPKAGQFSGGSVTVLDKGVDVAALLKEGNGKIVLDLTPADLPDDADESTREEEAARLRDVELLANALDGFPALKRTEIGESKASGGSKS